jgi:O-antigen ligase
VLPLALVLVPYYRGRARYALFGITAVCGLLVVATYTRDAWIAAIVSVGYLGVRFRRQLLWLMLGAIVVLLIAVPSVTARFADLHAKPLTPGAPPPPNSLSWRISYWHSLIPLADADPVTGIGFETVERTTPEQLAPHNGFVEAYVETGVIGLAAFTWVCWELLVYLRRRARSALPGYGRLLALGAVAVALALFVQIPGENLLTQTFVFWYAAVAMTFGLPSPVGRAAASVVAGPARVGALQAVN